MFRVWTLLLTAAAVVLVAGAADAAEAVQAKTKQSSGPFRSRFGPLVAGGNVSLFGAFAVSCGAATCDAATGACTRPLVVAHEEERFGFAPRAWRIVESRTFPAADGTAYCQAIAAAGSVLLLEATAADGCTLRVLPLSAEVGTGGAAPVPVAARLPQLSTTAGVCAQWSVANDPGTTVLFGGYDSVDSPYIFDNFIFAQQQENATAWRQLGRNVTGSGASNLIYVAADGESFSVVDDIFSWDAARNEWTYNLNEHGSLWIMHINNTCVVATDPDYDSGSGRVLVFKRGSTAEPWNLTADNAAKIVELSPRVEGGSLAAAGFVGPSTLIAKLAKHYSAIDLDAAKPSFTQLSHIKSASVVAGRAASFVALHYTDASKGDEVVIYPLGAHPMLLWWLCIGTVAACALLLPVLLGVALCMCHKFSTPGGAHRYRKLHTAYASINDDVAP